MWRKFRPLSFSTLQSARDAASGAAVGRCSMGAGLTLCSMFTVSARRERAAYGWGLNDSRAVPEGSCLVDVTCENRVRCLHRACVMQ